LLKKKYSKFKSSLSIKIFAITFSILFSLCMFLYFVLRVYMPQSIETDLNKSFYSGFEDLIIQLEESTEDDFISYLTNFCIVHSAQIRITDSHGNDIYNFQLTNETLDGEALLTAASSFERSGQEFSIEATTYLSTVSQINDLFMKIFPYTLLLIFVVSFLVALFYSRSFARPVVTLSNIAQKMSGQNFTWKCDISRTDEIGILASSLNEMSENLSISFQRLQAANNELETANLKLEDDIQMEKTREQQRSNLFSSMSHELKTPLTILQGDLEGMIMNIGRFKDRDRYLQHALDTAKEMQDMIQEILWVSQVQGESQVLSKRHTNMYALVKKCISHYQEPAQNKKIEFKVKGGEELNCLADQKHLEKALLNIINNAVSYSPKGAQIQINLQAKNKTGILTIENSGTTIPEEQIPHLFEPFYRIDKSRNRNAGGTGLGLFLVKSILDMHGFKYILENTKTGVCFSVIFPVI